MFMPNGANDTNDKMFVRRNKLQADQKTKYKLKKAKNYVFTYMFEDKVKQIFHAHYSQLYIHLSSFNEAKPLNLSHANSNKHIQLESNKFLLSFLYFCNEFSTIVCLRITPYMHASISIGAHNETATTMENVQRSWDISSAMTNTHRLPFVPTKFP